MIRKAKSSYNRRIIEKNSDDPKNFWKAVKKVLPNKSNTPQPSASLEPITVDGKTNFLFCNCCGEIAFKYPNS